MMNEYTVIIKSNRTFEDVSVIEAEDTPSAILAANRLCANLQRLVSENLRVDSIELGNTMGNTLDYEFGLI